MTRSKSEERATTTTAVRVKHDSSAAAELNELLRTGPFEAALRTAIRARRLSLERIQYRLRARGTPVSITALSYWQSGRRRPERPDSLLALAQLESVLGLHAGALSALLGPPRPRGRNRQTSTDVPTLHELWSHNASATALLSQVDTSAEDKLTRLSQQDLVQVDARGDQRELRARHLLRAERAGVDRWVVLFDGSSGAPDPSSRKPGQSSQKPSIQPVRGCRLGQVLTDSSSPVVVAELLFERPLDRGQTLLLEYDLVEPAPGRTDTTYCRLFRHPVRQYILELQFDPEAPPARCESFAADPSAKNIGTPERLTVDRTGHVHAVALDFGTGVFGVRWQPASVPESATPERIPALSEPR